MCCPEKILYSEVVPPYDQFEPVSLKRIICNNFASPSSLWLALHGRLTTKDRLVKWNVITNQQCSLCSEVDESLCHLFFECRFSNQIWREVLRLLGKTRAPMGFTEEVEEAADSYRKKQPRHLHGMLFAESVCVNWLLLETSTVFLRILILE